MTTQNDIPTTHVLLSFETTKKERSTDSYPSDQEIVDALDSANVRQKTKVQIE